MRPALLLALAALALGAPAAPAQLLVGYGGGSDDVIGTARVPFTLTGELTVEFRSGPGCEEAGLCGIEGTSVLDAGGDGEAFVTRFRGGRGMLFLAFGGLGGDARVVTRVHRTASDGSRRRCVDQHGFDAFEEASEPRRTVIVRVPGRELAGRCAGPTPADLDAVLPAAEVPVARLLREGAEVDLGSQRSFEAGGITGVVRSTLRMRFARPRGRQPELRSGGGGPDGRMLTVEYAPQAASGAVTVDFAETPDPFPCSIHDACGVSGTVSFTPDLRGRLTVSAHASGRRPWRDLETALGLRSGGRTKGVETFAFGGFENRAPVTGELRRPDGPPCRSQGALPGLGVMADLQRRNRIELGTFGAAPATRCGGPSARDLEDGVLASGELRRADLRGRTLRLPFTRGVTVDGPVYRVTTRSSLTLELRRVSVRRTSLNGP